MQKSQEKSNFFIKTLDKIQVGYYISIDDEERKNKNKTANKEKTNENITTVKKLQG